MAVAGIDASDPVCLHVPKADLLKMRFVTRKTSPRWMIARLRRLSYVQSPTERQVKRMGELQKKLSEWGIDFDC